MRKFNNWWLMIVLSIFTIACSSPSSKKQKTMEQTTDTLPGTYGYDVAFVKAHQMNVIELRDENNEACLLIAPGLQGRVLTSSANGDKGKSFGWINYKLIESGQVSQQFNPYGGEERFWLGPEGGPFSIYFPEGKEQVFENWDVPPVLDTEAFEVAKQSPKRIKFVKNTVLKNTSGTEFKLGIERSISLLSRDTLVTLFKTEFPSTLQIVAYQSENSIANQGNEAWTKEKGLLSIWMLSMFNPSPTTTVFIPYSEESSGTIVNDNYFGKVPEDRLKAENGTIYFKIDGKLRSKIGLPPGRAKELCGSYDSEQKVLTLLWCSLPTEPKSYVNSKWGEQDNPYEGDVINSYNDGPVDDGSIMGPFYEIETSSPAAELQPGESLTHIQRIVHLQGEETELAKVVKALFDLDLQTIYTKFQ